MEIYLSIDSVPELRDLPRSEKRLLHREAVLGMRYFWRSVAANSFAVGVMFFLWTITPKFPQPSGYVCGAIGLVFACIVLGQLSTQIERPILRKLRERDYGEHRSRKNATALE
jgi:uncharacterized membrane protein